MKVALTCRECGQDYTRTPSAAKNSKFCSNACRAQDFSRKALRDRTGERYGRWIVLEQATKGKCGDNRWLCRCDCGTEREVFGNSLTSGGSTSCGCYHKEVSREQAKRLFTKPIKAGSQFGRLTVLKPEGRKGGQIAYRCLCDCGAETVVRSADLRSGNTKSCGCYNIDQIRKRSTTHGLTGKPGFSQWRHQQRREADSEWTVEMAQFLLELQPACVVCGSTNILSIDHVRPMSKGYGLEPGNAAVLCKSCNSRKHDKDLSQLPWGVTRRILEAAEDFWLRWQIAA